MENHRCFKVFILLTVNCLTFNVLCLLYIGNVYIYIYHTPYIYYPRVQLPEDEQ